MIRRFAQPFRWESNKRNRNGVITIVHVGLASCVYDGALHIFIAPFRFIEPAADFMSGKQMQV